LAGLAIRGTFGWRGSSDHAAFLGEADAPGDLDIFDSTSTMNCQELAQRIEKFHPEAEVRDVARLCLLLANTMPDVERLADDQVLARVWKDIHLRMQATADQHAAMTEELETLARSDPKKFTPDQIWVLIRAIKVQSQMLQLYLGDTALAAC
jgi:hypothetical protein